MNQNRFYSCSGSYKQPVPTEFQNSVKCPDCRQAYSLGALAGSARATPLHSPWQKSDHDAAETATGVQ